MRVILAGLFVFVGIMLAVALIGTAFNHVNPAAIGLTMGILVVGLTLVAFFAFNTRLPGKSTGVTPEQYRLQLEEQGLLETRDFRATRAFVVEEYEDEGPHYFLDLMGGGVLYLSGQYLYVYEPIDEYDPYPRRFPCTEFTVRRHKTKDYTFDIDCRGKVLEPEIVVPSDEAQWYDWKDMPGDGDVIEGRTFDELKGMILGKRPESH